MYIANENLKVGETRAVHKFEYAGLGKAPFRFTGQVDEIVQIVPGVGARASGSCDYCGACIRYAFWVQSADKKTFKVGCDCIRKTSDAALVQQISVAERKLRDAKNAQIRQAKKAREQARLDAAMAKLPQVAGTLAGKPHPRGRQGETLLDYIRWMIANGFAKSILVYIEEA